jgi:hypothetical protein
MKRLMSLMLIGIICSQSILYVGGSTDDKSYVHQSTSLNIDPPVFKEKGPYLSVQLNDSSFIYEYGKPMMPCFTKLLSFPFGSEIIDVNVQYGTKAYHLSKDICPCPLPNGDGIEYTNMNDELFEDPLIYGSDQLYPQTAVSYQIGSGLSYDEHVLFLTVKVASQYNPLKDIIYVPSSITINVTYEPSNQELFLNDEYDMVLITTMDFSDSLLPLIAHKESVGIRTYIKTVEEIYNEYDGYDQAESIKYYIKDALESFGIKYALIVGDVTIVPMRKSEVIVFTQPTIWKGILTDLYYADVYDGDGGFSDWDSNDNNKFGECRLDLRPLRGDLSVIDEIDLYPDVRIGRLPCSNEEEVGICCDKIIYYENNSMEKDWFNRVILMGGDTQPDDEAGILEGEWILETAIAPFMEKNGFSPVKLYTSHGTFYPTSINQNISKGAGFVCYAGHGNTYLISTYPPYNSSSIPYYLEDIAGMNNDLKYPIFFLDACLTGKLDYNILDDGILILYPFCLLKLLLEHFFSFDIHPCFAWSLLKKQAGGGIAVLAASQPSWTGSIIEEDECTLLFGCSVLNRYFFESYEEGIIVSDMLIQAQNQYISMISDQYGIMWDRNTIDQYNLIGDPSLKVGGYQ